MASGSKVFVESCSFPFTLALGGGNNNVVKSGTEIDTGDEPFDNITIINPNTTVVLKIVIWIGTARVKFNYAAVPGTRLVQSAGYFSATHVGSSISGFSGSGAELFPGVATTAAKYANAGVPEGSRRKQFVISNRQATLIYATNLSGMAFGVTIQDDDYTLECDDDFKIWGTLSATYYVAEIFYL